MLKKLLPILAGIAVIANTASSEPNSTDNSRLETIETAGCRQNSIVESYMRTASLILLQTHGYTEPFANEMVSLRFSEIATLARQSMPSFDLTQLEVMDDDSDPKEQFQTWANAWIYTFSTDAAYILSDPDRKLTAQRRQYNAYLSMAETSYARALETLGIHPEAAKLGWSAFRAQEASASDYFDRPRVAALDKVLSQEDLSIALVRFQKSLDTRTQEFASVLTGYQSGDPERSDIDFRGQVAMAQVYGTFFGSQAISYFAGKNRAFLDEDSPINAIAPCSSQTAGFAPGGTLIFEYFPPEDFSAQAIIQNWWLNPLPLKPE